MAKNPGPSFFDKHIEKVIVAICALFALVAIWYYGVSTPLRLEVPTGVGRQSEAVEPSEVDSSLYHASKRLEDKINSKTAEPIVPRDDVQVLAAYQKMPIGGIDLASVDFGTPMTLGKKLMGTNTGKTRLVTIEDMAKAMPKPSTPFSWTGIELLGAQEFSGDETIDEGQLREDPIWRAVSYYPNGELKKAWENALTNTIVVPQVVVLDYEVEIQEQRPNGQWETIENVRPFEMPADTTNAKNDQPPVIPDFIIDETGQSNLDDVRKIISDLDSWTFIKIQPEYFNVWTKDGQISWQQHMPLEKIKSLYKDVVDSSAAPAATPARTGRRAARAAAMPQPGMYPTGGPMMMPTDPMMAQPRATARRKTSRRGVAGAADVLPTVETQITAGKPLAWFHVNNIQFGKKYRCRFRWIFVNPLFTYVKSVDPKKVEDAYAKIIKSPWSDWSKPISVNRKMEFFITGSNSQQKELTLTVFTEVLGQLVRAKFGQIGVGKEIGGTSEVSVVNPATGTRQKMQLKFDTGSVVLDINFDRRLVTKSGLVKKDAVEMVYSDSSGNVHSRVMYNDKNSAEFLSLTEEAVRGEPKREVLAPEKKTRERKPSRKTRAVTPGEMPMMPPDMMMPGAGNTRGRNNTRVRF